jgi:signal transduction histidine kinase
VRPRRLRPLDPLSSIKFKLSVVIVAAVGVIALVLSFGLRADMPIVLVGLASGVLALGVVHVLARGMTSPLREMAAAARAMARGDYSRRVTASSRDEVGELARAFNVSHELRTPITALRAALENLVDGVEPPDPHTLHTMLAQVERLGRLVDQLLDLSRLESGVVPMERRPFELRRMLEQAVRESRLHAAQHPDRGVRLNVEVRPPRLRADGDVERIHEVVSNLLENAVRHSPEGGEVTVRAHADPEHVWIEVADQGPGIPRDEASRVFERFYRADAARAARDGGTGLGLAIAKWIVDAHGGDIRVERNEPRGCRMVVALPRGIA